MLVASAVFLLGAVWIALGFIGYAIFAALAPSLGVPGAALVAAAAFLAIAGIAALLLSRKIENAKRGAMLAGLAGTGAANAALGLVAKRPLLTLGIAGALAAFFLRGSTPSR